MRKKIESIKNLVRNLRRLGFKGFMQKWREGMLKIPPEEQIRIQLRGTVLTIIGTIVSCILIVIFAKAVWYIIFAFIFSVITQFGQAVGLYQQLKQLEALKQLQSEEIQKQIVEMLNIDLCLKPNKLN